MNDGSASTSAPASQAAPPATNPLEAIVATLEEKLKGAEALIGDQAKKIAAAAEAQAEALAQKVAAEAALSAEKAAHEASAKLLAQAKEQLDNISGELISKEKALEEKTLHGDALAQDLVLAKQKVEELSVIAQKSLDDVSKEAIAAALAHPVQTLKSLYQAVIDLVPKATKESIHQRVSVEDIHKATGG